jgi:RNA polymerase sigma factor (sigma-70 family)
VLARQIEDRSAGFPSTYWASVWACAHADGQAELARSELCRRYWYPVYAHLRRVGHSGHDAEDLTQGFFAYILQRPWFAQVDRTKGKFRSFLLATLKNFLRDELDQRMAQKRGGRCQHIPLDASEGESRFLASLASKSDSQALYEVDWAAAVVDAALNRLEEEYSDSGKKPLFECLRIYLTTEGSAISYEAAGAALGISPEAVKVSAHRLRKRYGAILREEVARTVDPDYVDEELGHLRSVIAAGLG